MLETLQSATQNGTLEGAVESTIPSSLLTVFKDALTHEQIAALTTDAQYGDGAIVERFISLLKRELRPPSARRLQKQAVNKAGEILKLYFDGADAKEVARERAMTTGSLWAFMTQLKSRPGFNADMLAAIYDLAFSDADLTELLSGQESIDDADSPAAEANEAVSTPEVQALPQEASLESTNRAAGKVAINHASEDPEPTQSQEAKVDGERTDHTLLAKGADSVRQYLSAIGRIELLKPEEEVELAKQIEAGVLAQEALDKCDGSPEFRTECHYDPDDLEFLVEEGRLAKERLINANLRLVVSTARPYIKTGRNMGFLDMIQEGNLGLIRAVEMFDHTKTYKDKSGNVQHIKFSTYAVGWIKQGITRAMANKERTIRLPVHVEAQLKKLEKAKAEFALTHGHEPSRQELDDATELDTRKLEEDTRNFLFTPSLNEPVGYESDTEVGDLVGEEQDETDHVVTSLTKDLNIDLLVSLGLTPLMLAMVRARYGYDGEPMTFNQIGERYEMTHQSVSKLFRRLSRAIQDNKEVVNKIAEEMGIDLS